MNAQPKPNMGGEIHGISLSAFLQMSEMEKTTCALKVSSDEGVGYLFLKNGELIAAKTNYNSGEDAVYEIVGWDESVIEIKEKNIKQKREINKPLMTLLMEGLKQKDEKSAGTSSAGSKTTPKKTAPKKRPKKPPPSASVPTELSNTSDTPPKTTASPATPKSKKSNRGCITAITAVVVLGILVAGGIFGWLRIISPMLVKKDYDQLLADVKQTAKRDQKESILKKYISSHPNSVYLREVENMLVQNRQLMDKQDYETVLKNIAALTVDDDYKDKAMAIYNQYLTRHPKGTYVTQINAQIKTIPSKVDDYDYKKLLDINEFDYEGRISAYNTYLTEHPQGSHIDSVRKLLKDLGDTYYSYLNKEINECNRQKKWDICIELCNNFIVSYKKSRYLNKVIALRLKMNENTEYYDLKRAAESKGTDYPAAKALYTNYLAKNPTASTKSQIMAEISILDKQLRRKQQWEATYNYCKNPKFHVSSRIDTLKNYILKNTSSPYLDQANIVLTDLKKEEKEFLNQLKLSEQKRIAEEKRLAVERKEKLRLENEKERLRAATANSNGRYRVDADGTITDTKTGLMWTMLDSQFITGECMDYTQAQEYVNQLTTGGYSDWRLPTSNNLLVIYLNQPYFPSGDAKWYWTSEAFWKGSHEKVKVIVNQGGNNWNRGSVDIEACGVVRAVRP